jgi:hypothetical protein
MWEPPLKLRELKPLLPCEPKPLEEWENELPPKELLLCGVELKLPPP